ncbi:hypothetical protein SELMODRAFT_427305 [Selaginella moellendorffii]|uniref:Tify domain-containing protein n=1 Tax=Selaginella moellendorffii TaxID=88036 RepID=D8SZ66_SELML|nr:hypothetical protein SELMODRAFT_427305 [Selaginella moellendorffii]
MSRARTDSKLFRSTGSVGKPGRKPAVGGSPVAAAAASSIPVKESPDSSQQVDPDLTRALKQIFEVRNCKLKDHGSSHNNNSNSSSKNSSEESCLTLFGRKLASPSSSLDGSDGNTKNVANQYSRQGTDKLPPAATAHLLKELHKQRLKQRGITASANDFPDMGEIEFVHTERRPEVSTLPLLNNLQEKRPLENASDCSPEAKRQRIEKDKSLDLSLSVEFGSPDEAARDSNNTQSMDIAAEEERTHATVKDPEQLTLFYNGQVLVYDDVPSDKAKAIMVLASSISSKTSCYTPCLAAATAAAAKATGAATAPPIVVPTTAKASNSLYPSPKGTTPAADKRSSSNDVQARKASISRFLVKRKDRLSAKPAEKAEASSKSSAKDISQRSRSPSPAASSSPVTPPRASPPRLVDELKLQLEKGEMLKRSIPANAGSATAAAAAPRQWIVFFSSGQHIRLMDGRMDGRLITNNALGKIVEGCFV